MIPSGLPDAIAYARIAPSTAPIAEEMRQSSRESVNADRTGPVLSAEMLASVHPPLFPLNAFQITMPVGSSRKIPAYARNGTVPTQARGGRRPARAGRASASVAVAIVTTGA